MLLDVFELNGKYYIYAVGPNGEAMGEPRGGPFDSEEIARAELAKMRGAPATQSAPAQAPQRIPAKSTTATAETVTITRAEFAALQSQVSAQSNQIKAMQAAGTGRITGGQDLAEEGAFKTLGANMIAIKEACAKGGAIHPRLRKLHDNFKAATGANESVGSEGGFLLEPTISKELLLPLTMPDESPFFARARKLPVGENSNSGWINGVNETTHANGSLYGGLIGYRLAEAGQKTASKPDFRRINWSLKKYAVMMYATDELLQDSTQLAGIWRNGAGRVLQFMVNDDILNGAGTAGPFGILNSTGDDGSLITIAKESGQAAATVVNKNLIKMWSAMHPRFRGSAFWFINSEVEPELDVLSIPVGASALEPRYVTYGSDGVMRIKGRPVVVTEFNSALGTVGDVVLASMEDYLVWERAPEFAASIHLRFDYDEQVFRAVARYDGKPATPKLTPYKATSGAKQSAFVALATRA